MREWLRVMVKRLATALSGLSMGLDHAALDRAKRRMIKGDRTYDRLRLEIEGPGVNTPKPKVIQGPVRHSRRVGVRVPYTRDMPAFLR